MLPNAYVLQARKCRFQTQPTVVRGPLRSAKHPRYIRGHALSGSDMHFRRSPIGNRSQEPSNSRQIASSRMPTGSGAVDQQASSHPSSTQPISTRERSVLPSPTEPQARSQNIGSMPGSVDRFQPDDQSPGRIAIFGVAIGSLTLLHS